MHASSHIVRDVIIKGTLEFHDSLFLDSAFEGEILGDGDLTIGANASIEGDIHVCNVTILGQIKGNIFAEELCSIMNTGSVTGDIKSQRIRLEEGSSFHGYAKVPFNPLVETELALFEDKKTEKEDPVLGDATKESAIENTRTTNKIEPKPEASINESEEKASPVSPS